MDPASMSPEMMASMQKTMADPAMMGMMKNMVSSIAPEDLANMLGQQGVQVTPEQVENLDQKLLTLTLRLTSTFELYRQILSWSVGESMA